MLLTIDCVVESFEKRNKKRVITSFKIVRRKVAELGGEISDLFLSDEFDKSVKNEIQSRIDRISGLKENVKQLHSQAVQGGVGFLKLSKIHRFLSRIDKLVNKYTIELANLSYKR